MSSLQNATKSQKTHRERHQPKHRESLGLLEKKKDYRQRADDYNRKRATLKKLRKKALNKNPDEFYHHMINSKTVDGVHREKKKDVELTEEQVALMQTQDLNYIVGKRTSERNKIKKLQSSLHLISSEDKPKNKHIFFVDSDADKKSFSVAERLDTHPAFLSRTHNRPKLSDFEAGKFDRKIDEGSLSEVATRTHKAYKELQQRIEREKQLTVVQEKMDIKKKLQSKKEKPIKTVLAEQKNSAPVFLWPVERKK